MTLISSSVWTCDNHDDNVGSSEYTPSQLGLETSIHPSGNHWLGHKNEDYPSCCEWLLESDGSFLQTSRLSGAQTENMFQKVVNFH